VLKTNNSEKQAAPGGRAAAKSTPRFEEFFLWAYNKKVSK